LRFGQVTAGFDRSSIDDPPLSWSDTPLPYENNTFVSDAAPASSSFAVTGEERVFSGQGDWPDGVCDGVGVC
jgi:hypothetical protein